MESDETSFEELVSIMMKHDMERWQWSALQDISVPILRSIWKGDCEIICGIQI